MRPKYVPTRRVSMIVIPLIIVLIVSALSMVYMNNVPVSSRHAPPSWNHIIPGKSDLRQVLEIMGPPDQVENIENYPTRADAKIFALLPQYQVYIYREKTQDWKHVEIWMRNDSESDSQIVVAVLLTLRDLAPQNPVFLGDYVRIYGQPDQVMWTLFPRSRYLIWVSAGVAVSAKADLAVRHGTELTYLTWADIPIYEMLFFEPMSIEQFRETRWPWPNNGAGWSTQNLYPPGQTDAPDSLPEDPYDWSKLP